MTYYEALENGHNTNVGLTLPPRVKLEIIWDYLNQLRHFELWSKLYQLTM